MDEMQPLFLEGRKAQDENTNPNRKSQFAETIFKGSRIEALRLAQNTYENLTNCHIDKQNDKVGIFGTVLSISKTDSLIRQVVISYSHKCIRESCQREISAKNYLGNWIDYIDNIETDKNN